MAVWHRTAGEQRRALSAFKFDNGQPIVHVTLLRQIMVNGDRATGKYTCGFWAAH